jgi:hypothetical protein
MKKNIYGLNFVAYVGVEIFKEFVVRYIKMCQMPRDSAL